MHKEGNVPDTHVRDGPFRPATLRHNHVGAFRINPSVAAAAKSLDLAEGTVKARLSRARDMLRRKLPHVLTAKRAKEL